MRQSQWNRKGGMVFKKERSGASKAQASGGSLSRGSANSFFFLFTAPQRKDPAFTWKTVQCPWVPIQNQGGLPFIFHVLLFKELYYLISWNKPNIFPIAWEWFLYFIASPLVRVWGVRQGFFHHKNLTKPFSQSVFDFSFSLAFPHLYTKVRYISWVLWVSWSLYLQ